MAKIQCKMCGGMNEVKEGATSWECPYCGSLTTFPKLDTEHREQLYNRAEWFRQANNFDKAVAAYESILDLDNEDPEAWWGLLISKYGIEYVEDPATHERIPTCHRVQFESILADPDYLNALKYAVGYDRDIYEKEAKRISEIQKDILRISAQEKPYDVFICYKETTDGGSRTKDSVLAQDMYDHLVARGLKVFFARITLEKKLGRQYEPYIFAALNSAKVMLAVGTKKEHFEAVWVKNEWSRFLALMKKDRSRLLIPCCKDMDPYDLPEELSMFQCQDMGKIGFMQDLIYGIMKVVKAEENETKAAASSGDGAFESAKIAKRIAVLMKQGEWNEAGSYCKKLLESDPENPELYLMMCMISRQIPDEDALRNSSQNLSVDKNFIIALQYASPERKKQLESIGQDAMVNFLLMKCMQKNRISDLSQLFRCNAPLRDDPDFKAALQTASPERRKELLQIQYAQADFFLDGIRQRLGVASFEQATVPLGSNAQFQTALKLASPERQEELKDIQRKQFDHFLGKCMEARHVSNAADLARTFFPLSESQDFMTALLCAPPERLEELTKLIWDQAEFFIRKSVERNNVSSEVELPFSETPLNGDSFFLLACKYASPERRTQLERIQAAQSDNFLRKCMEEHHVSDAFDLAKNREPLNTDENFSLALESALPAQKKRLDQIASKQRMRFAARKAKHLVRILIVVAVLLALSAVVWFNRLTIGATLGGAEAKYRLAKRYENGYGVERDLAKAMKWYRKAARQGHAEAKEVLLGTIALPGGHVLKMVKVEVGAFEMSAWDGENYDGEVAHHVTLTKDFYIGRTEVTQAQWRAVMGSNPSNFKGDDLPVENVSWNDAMEFCEKLNSMGKAPDGWKFTLPTETQWEYAARGGNKSMGYKYSGSDDIYEVAWYNSNSGNRTQPVAQKKANELGLYDMSGNVWEWCLDDWTWDSRKQKPEFTRGNDSGGSYRVNRGGSWFNGARHCRSADRSVNNAPGGRFNYLGFRLALVPESY